jgi:translocation protein SEC62
VQKELIKVATLLQKKGLKEKEAVVDRQRVYYFRADKFHELVLKHKDEVLKLLDKSVTLDKLESVDDAQQIGDIMINNGLLRCFDRVKDDIQKFKYPKKLAEIKSSMHPKGFYAFQIYKSQTKMTVLAIVMAISIIAIILFPLWPYSVKLAIFNVMFYFSAGMLSMIAFRLILWIFLFPLGIDVWIFPNLFDDDAGLADSFMPVLLLNRREDSWLVFVLRVLMVVIFAAY